MDDPKPEIEQTPDWKEGKTPEEIADAEQKGEALVRHLEFLDAHPEIEPSPEEATTGHILKKIIEEKEAREN